MKRSGVAILRLQVTSISFVLLFTFGMSRAQCVDSSEVTGFTVRKIHLDALFGRISKRLQKQLDAHRGETYSAARARSYINEIVAFYDNDLEQQRFERLVANKLKLSLKGGVTELQCVTPVPLEACRTSFEGAANCVDITINRYFIEVDALDASPYLLLLPRTASTVFYGAFPRALLALNPAFRVDEDRTFGPSVAINTATDLLDLNQLFTSDNGHPKSGSSAEVQNTDGKKKDIQLLLRTSGAKSLNRKFYDSDFRLSFARRSAFDALQTISAEASFQSQHSPRGQGELRRNSEELSLSTGLRTQIPAIQLLNIAAAYVSSRNNLLRTTTGAERTKENGYRLSLLADGQIRRGLFRAALWTDGAKQNNSWYRRMITRIGYAKEFGLQRRAKLRKIIPPELGVECWTNFEREPQHNQHTLGLEIVAGAGRTFGDTPEHAGFFAGRPVGNFLEDDLADESVARVPFGPIARNLGRGEGTLNNGNSGNSFWHINVNLAIPIARWSRPLIPHEWVTASPMRADDRAFTNRIPSDELVCRDLKSVVKNLVGVSGLNLMVNQQARDLLTDEQKQNLRLRVIEDRSAEQEAQLMAAERAWQTAKVRVRAQVERIFARDILPVTNFIADHANTFSVKPLFMFDAARLGGNQTEPVTRWSIGGGVQLDIVLARFEVGYLAALKRADNDSRGSFVGRLVLRRLF